MDTSNWIKTHAIIAILRDVPSERIVDTVRALYDGGIRCCEVPFRPRDRGACQDVLKGISLLRTAFGETMALGAGTVLTPDDVTEAAKAGATYMVSPNTNAAVIAQTKALGLLSVPGAMTPTEAVTAHDAGADFVKLFPAGNLGLGYIKALMGPLSHIPFVAVGGVNAQNTPDFLRIGCVGVGVGGNLADLTLIRNGDYEGIRKLAEAYRQG